MISPITVDGAFILCVSVIIPAINEEANIAAAIGSATAAGADEIIVADGGSTDATCERALAVRVITTAPGRAKQQNAGAEVATGDILLFLHADARLADTSLKSVRSACQTKPFAWGAFWQRIDARGAAYRLLEQGNALRVAWRGIAYGDQGIWMSRSTFRQVGGFPDVPLLEDLLLSRALRRLCKPVLLPDRLTISARRWQQHGVLRQTFRNWGILAAHARGVSPQELVERYRRHDR